MTDVVYRYTDNTEAFHFQKLPNGDDYFVKGLMGPIGSGKSVACCWDIMMLAINQSPNKDGLRKSRWAIIRNSYRELADTTMKTWFDWFPESLGFYKGTDSKFIMKKKLPDGTSMELEILFRALDKPKDVKKLLSLELTGAWINEAREVPKQVLDMLQGRVGRYPSMRDGGASWFGIIMDTNPPDEDHWWHRVFEDEKPHNWLLVRQPSGVSEDADNIENLPKDYYQNMMAGKDQEWINVYVHGKYGYVMDGKPVYQSYNDKTHYDAHLEYNPNLPVYVGMDFGLTPAMAIAQVNDEGQILIIDEIVSQDIPASIFADVVKKHFAENEYILEEGWGDPAGDFRAQTDARTPFQIMQENGIYLYPTNTNDPQVRTDAVATCLMRNTFTGLPMVQVGPKAKMIRKGFNGGYKYRRIQVSNTEIYQDKPDKNIYSHVHDGLQYLFVGLGYGDRMIYGDDGSDMPKVKKGLR